MISPPQRKAHLFWLVFLTFGLYACVFLWRNARDLKHLDGKPTRPWLWAVAPLVPISLPFLLGNMADRYEALSVERGADFRNRGRWLGVLAFLALLVQNLYSFITPNFVMLVMIACAAVFAVLFALLGADIAAFKDTFPEEELSGRKRALSSGQLVTLLVGGLLCGGIYLLVSMEELSHLGRTPLPVGERWYSPQGDYSLEPQDEWAIAEVGTFSDGSAEVEFALSTSVSTVVFDHTVGGDINTMADFRRSEAHEEDAAARCQERRTLQQDTLNLIAVLTCSGSVLGDRSLMMSYQIQNEDQHLEIYGKAYPTALGEEAALDNMLRFARSVRLLKEAAES